MKCKICQKSFFIKRKIKDLLAVQKYFICDDCYNKYKIKLGYNILPLENHNLIIYSLFEEEYIFKGDPFIIEYSELFNYVLESNSNAYVICEKNVHITKYKIEMFSILSKLVNSDIILFCNAFTT